MTHMYINMHFMRYKVYVICKYINIYKDSMYMYHMSYRNIFVAHLPTFLSIRAPYGRSPGHWITGPKDANAGAAVFVARLTDPEAAGTRA